MHFPLSSNQKVRVFSVKNIQLAALLHNFKGHKKIHQFIHFQFYQFHCDFIGKGRAFQGLLFQKYTGIHLPNHSFNYCRLRCCGCQLEGVQLRPSTQPRPRVDQIHCGRRDGSNFRAQVRRQDRCDRRRGSGPVQPGQYNGRRPESGGNGRRAESRSLAQFDLFIWYLYTVSVTHGIPSTIRCQKRAASPSQRAFHWMEKSLQSKLNANLSQQTFWHCHEKGLVNTISMIPHNRLMEFHISFPVLWFDAYQGLS